MSSKILVWFHPISLSLKFEENPSSSCWDNRLLIFWGCLYFRQHLFWFGPLSLSLKFEKNPSICCWDIQLLIFGWLLPSEVVFISSQILFWLGPLRLGLKFEEDHWRWFPFQAKYKLEIFHFWYWRFSSIGGRLHFKNFFILVWTPKLRFEIWGRSDQWLLRYSTFNILRSSSVRGRFPSEVVFISSQILFWFGPLSLVLTPVLPLNRK
jgi:hypothetical protein